MSYLSKLLSKLESLKSDKNDSLLQEEPEKQTLSNPVEKTRENITVIRDSPTNLTQQISDNTLNLDEFCNTPSESPPSKSNSSCELCTTAQFKYTCPGCGVKTCSLPCVKEHKIRLSCSGERVKTAFVDKSQYSDCHLLNDYRFLESAERSVYSNKIGIKNRHFGGRQHQHHRMTPYHTQHSKRATILMSAASKRGIHLRMMPDHLEKHKANTSFYTISSDVIEWHIEWQFVSAKCLIKDEKLPESTVLLEAVKKYGNAVDYPHLRKTLEDYRKKLHLCRYLIKVEGMPANRKRFIELYPSLTIAENLKGLCLLEHPTIFVLPPNHSCDDFQLLNKDDDLTYMHTGNMKHLTRHHPDFSTQVLIQDQLLNPSSSIYTPDNGEEDEAVDGIEVTSDSDN